MANILVNICDEKRKHVAKQKMKNSEAKLLKEIRKNDPPRGFLSALKAAKNKKEIGLIAEIKRASPSKGIIRKDFNPAKLAKSYKSGGATCISVLTDKPFFQGSDLFLKQTRETTDLPIIRKDFIIDPYQIVESRVIGADCILVIMACVDDSEASDFTTTAHELGMDVLIEVHTPFELERASKLSPELIGINNRNLKTLEVKLDMTEKLAPMVNKSSIVVSESGIYSHSDIMRMQKLGVNSFLVGESLMRENDVETATKRLLGIDI